MNMPPEQSLYGSFSIVEWQPRLKGWEDAEEPVPPAHLVHCLIMDDKIRAGIDKFYEHYVVDGQLEQELNVRKKRRGGCPRRCEVSLVGETFV